MFTVTPIGFVHNQRNEILDDHWASIHSTIILADEISEETLVGIDEYSHLEVIYYFDKVLDEKISFRARHPRNNPTYPQVGIFAQRAKNRPNKIGLTTVELVKRTNKTLYVHKLDAIDGTPILDIKPVMKEFLPHSQVKQPSWSSDLMKNYW